MDGTTITESLPGYPGPAAWRGSDDRDEGWIDESSELEEAELRTAANRVPEDYASWIG